MNTARFSELVELFIDQQLSDDEAAELRAMVELEPQAAERFAHEVRQHLVFAVPMRQTALDRLPERIRALIHLDRTSKRASLITAVARRRRQMRAHSQWRFAALAAALMLVAGAVSWQWSHAGTARGPGDGGNGNGADVAVLSPGPSTGLLRAGKRSAVTDLLAVMPGDRIIARTPGSVVTFEDGTKVSLDPGTVLAIDHIHGGLQMTLAAGALRAEVAHQPPDQPMSLWGPDGVAKVVGTAFRFSSEPLGTRLMVSDGLVEFADRRGSPAIRVSAGQQARASHSRAAKLLAEPAPRGRLQLVDGCEDPSGWISATLRPESTIRLAVTSDQPYEGRGALRATVRMADVGGNWATLNHALAIGPDDRALSFRLRVEEAELGSGMSIHAQDEHGNLWKLAYWPIAPGSEWQEIRIPLAGPDLAVQPIQVAAGVGWNALDITTIKVVIHGGESQVCVDALAVERR